MFLLPYSILKFLFSKNKFIFSKKLFLNFIKKIKHIETLEKGLKIFKVNNFTPFSSISIVDFEQVYVS